MVEIPYFELTKKRTPDFGFLLKVLRREVTERPVLFEMTPNVSVAQTFLGDKWLSDEQHCGGQRNFMNAHRVLGYDYSVVPTWPYALVSGGNKRKKRDGALTRSLNEGWVINNEESFEKYEWPTHNETQYERMGELAAYVPEGMKLLLRSAGSVEEGMINLVGYENLCMMMYENLDLVQAIADRVGAFVVRHFELGLQHSFIGAALLSDDWGFKTQTLFPPKFLRTYILPWHKKVVDLVHKANRPIILHSCGQVETAMDDVIDICKYDGKHSFEDEIIPVEQAYERWGDRIAILGGIDVDFLCRKTPEEIFNRCRQMVESTMDKGGYALGSGNSIPDYMPRENYMAMLRAALL